MKKFLILGVFLLGIVGCNTTQQKAAFNSISSVEQTVSSSYQAYVGLVVTGKIPTNDVPKVASALNHFQVATTLAVDLAQNNTNALAPHSLMVEAQDVINLINNITGKK